MSSNFDDLYDSIDESIRKYEKTAGVKSTYNFIFQLYIAILSYVETVEESKKLILKNFQKISKKFDQKHGGNSIKVGPLIEEFSQKIKSNSNLIKDMQSILSNANDDILSNKKNRTVINLISTLNLHRQQRIIQRISILFGSLCLVSGIVFLFIPQARDYFLLPSAIGMQILYYNVYAREYINNHNCNSYLIGLRIYRGQIQPKFSIA